MKISVISLLLIAPFCVCEDDYAKDKRASAKSPNTNAINYSQSDKQQGEPNGLDYSTQIAAQFGAPRSPQHDQFVPVQYVQPQAARLLIPQQTPQTAMLIIPAAVQQPQFSFASAQHSPQFAQAAQQLVQYYQSNPQARLQLLQGYQNAGHQIPTVPASSLQYGQLQLAPSSAHNQLARQNNNIGSISTLQQLQGTSPLQHAIQGYYGVLTPPVPQNAQPVSYSTSAASATDNYNVQSQNGKTDKLVPAASDNYYNPYIIRHSFKG